jgi:hypothetical protein
MLYRVPPLWPDLNRRAVTNRGPDFLDRRIADCNAAVGPAFALSLLIKPASDQHDSKNQSACAQERRNDVRRVFRGLKFQIPDVSDLLGLLGREYRDREPEQPKNDQNRSPNH